MSKGWLPAGLHEYARCEPGRGQGKAGTTVSAGDHFESAETGLHDGPWEEDHPDDARVFHVREDGRADPQMPAPLLNTLENLSSPSLIVYASGDTCCEASEVGGGDRIAPGILDCYSRQDA